MLKIRQWHDPTFPHAHMFPILTLKPSLHQQHYIEPASQAGLDGAGDFSQ
jgi:hypothetical protein